MAQDFSQKPQGNAPSPARPTSHMNAQKPLPDRMKELKDAIKGLSAPVPLILTSEEHTQRLQTWEGARSDYNYPPLKDPLFYQELSGGAYIDMRDCQVHMGEAVVNQLTATGRVTQDAAQRAIEDHEIGHYMVFPHNLATTILAGKMLNDFFPPQNAKHPGIQNYIFQLYADTANDTASVLTPIRREGILSMRSAFQSVEQTKTDLVVREILLAYLYHQAGEKFSLSPQLQKDLSEMHPEEFEGAGGEKVKGTYFEKWSSDMLKVNFLNRDTNNMRMSLYVFGTLINEILDKFPPPKQKGKGKGNGQQGEGEGEGKEGDGKASGQQGKEKKKGEGEGKEGEEGEEKEGKGKGEAQEGDEEGKGQGGKGSLGNPTGMPEDSGIGDIIGKATRGEIEQAIRELSKDVTKGELDRIKEWLGDKNPNKGQKNQAIGIGTSSGELEVDAETVQYYIDLSKQYPVIVAVKPMVLPSTKKSMSSTERMRIGKDPLLMLPHSSGGRILPGITKSVKITERPRTTRKFDVPNLLIVIDSSGSQPNPKEKKAYSVLAAVCAARSYHVHGSHIGVINFSGDSFFMDYTRDLTQACAGICSFQGGGTVVDIEIIKTMLEKGNAHFGRNRTAEEIAEELKGKNMRELEGLGLPAGAVRKSVTLNRASFEKALAGNDIDLIMFTDGGIANLRETLDFFEDRAQPNRATIILSGAGSFGDWFDYDSKTGKVKIIPVDKPADIPGIAIGEMGKNINKRAESGLLHRR